MVYRLASCCLYCFASLIINRALPGARTGCGSVLAAPNPLPGFPGPAAGAFASRQGKPSFLGNIGNFLTSKIDTMEKSTSVETGFRKFTIKDFEKELICELKMREKVWLKGYSQRFKDEKQNRRFAILEELLAIIEHCSYATFEKMRSQAESAAMVIQGSLGYEDF